MAIALEFTLAYEFWVCGVVGRDFWGILGELSGCSGVPSIDDFRQILP
jgi:hypothetical protein